VAEGSGRKQWQEAVAGAGSSGRRQWQEAVNIIRYWFMGKANRQIDKSTNTKKPGRLNLAKTIKKVGFTF